MVKLLGGREEEAPLDPFTIHPKINVRKRKKIMKAALTLKRVSLEINIGLKTERYSVTAGLQQGSTF
jgi:hypothetical protein